MRAGTVSAAVLDVSLWAPDSYADACADAKAQVAFGILVAQKGLWLEAIYRWERAAQIDPTYAAAWNNLAIAYEQRGRVAEARDACEEALTVDPKNSMIRQNHELFQEVHARATRRSR